jgi:hypothetical protein
MLTRSNAASPMLATFRPTGIALSPSRPGQLLLRSNRCYTIPVVSLTFLEHPDEEITFSNASSVADWPRCLARGKRLPVIDEHSG